jgi:hypothetical protein
LLILESLSLIRIRHIENVPKLVLVESIVWLVNLAEKHLSIMTVAQKTHCFMTLQHAVVKDVTGTY